MSPRHSVTNGKSDQMHKFTFFQREAADRQRDVKGMNEKPCGRRNIKKKTNYGEV